jgi:oligoendopeptidase F
MHTTLLPNQRLTRTFLPADFSVTTWEALEPWYRQLLDAQPSGVDELKAWLHRRSELESVVGEDLAWRYIRMNADTADVSRAEAFQHFIETIEPHLAPVNHALNQKLVAHPAADALQDGGHRIYLRNVRNAIELFREANIPLMVELSTLQQEYGRICSAMTIEHEGKELTLQQAARLLEEPDRDLRKRIYEAIQKRRLQDRDALDALLDKLIALRQQVARNAGFANFRDYMHQELGRFDYTVEDCKAFHRAVEKAVVPVMESLMERRRVRLHLDVLKPYDLDAEPLGQRPLQPFSGADDLVARTVACFQRVDPYFASCIATMKHLNYLDLESRKGKAPGGFNYPLMESGVPFIYMNAVDSHKDLVTMVHEGGHAVHSFLSNPLDLSAFKSTPSEVAELASMSMELISMEHWEAFYNPEDLKRARFDQLERSLETLPWVAAVDAFQHWLYEHDGHTPEMRRAAWTDAIRRFSPSNVDWTGYEDVLANQWQKQLHIYEVPFYYIEYGMAQLGAIAVWRNHRVDARRTVEQYKQALALGNTATIPNVYQAAGITFSFTEDYVLELMQAVVHELDAV